MLRRRRRDRWRLFPGRERVARLDLVDGVVLGMDMVLRAVWVLGLRGLVLRGRGRGARVRVLLPVVDEDLWVRIEMRSLGLVRVLGMLD